MQPAPNASDSQKKPKSVSDADFTRGLQDDDSHESHAPKEPHRTGHAGLVGMVVFVLLGAALLSPFIPGKIFSNFPGSSASSSSGDQELACADAVKNTSSADKYDSKLGSPIVYQYSTTTTQTGTCDGKSQTAVTGHTSQFNPLAAIVNLAIALVIAIVIAKIWRKIFSRHR